MTRETTNTVMAMVSDDSDPRFHACEIGTDKVQQLEFPRKRLLRVFGADVWVFDGFQKLIDRNQDTKMIFSSTSNMDGPTGMMELEAYYMS